MKKTFIVRNICQFAKTIGDMNPLHHNTILARKAGFEGVIAPGVMIMGFISATIAGMIPTAIARRLEVDFLNPLYEGSVVQIVCTTLKQKTSIAKVAVEVHTTNNGLVAKGSCLLLIPQMRKKQQESKKEGVGVV